MEPKSSSPYPQVPATRPYPEPTPSSPHDPLQLVFVLFTFCNPTNTLMKIGMELPL